jgi:hypothetical protein
MKSTYTAKKTILASSVFLGMAFGTAHAEKCYNLAPFVDILRLSALDLLGTVVGSTHTLVVGNWISTGNYTLPIVGSRALDLGTTPPTVKRFGLHGTNVAAAFFNGNEDCALDGIPGGTWTISCSGINTTFTNSGSPLTQVSCSGQPPSSPGKAAGATKTK